MPIIQQYLPKIHGRAVVCGDLARLLEEHHDYGDIVCGALPLRLSDQTLRHRLQVICTTKQLTLTLACTYIYVGKFNCK